MESKSKVQITVYDAPKQPGYYTVVVPGREELTVAGANGIAVAKQLSTLFPDYQFIYEKDTSYIYDIKVDSLVPYRQASPHALLMNGIAKIETACYEARRELTLAEDEKRTPNYAALVGEIVSAFNSADKYFWIAENPTSAKKNRIFDDLRPPSWTKKSSDTDGDYPYGKVPKDYDKNTMCNENSKKYTTFKVPFGVGYAFDGDINDIEKLTKQLETIFSKGFRR